MEVREKRRGEERRRRRSLSAAPVFLNPLSSHPVSIFPFRTTAAATSSSPWSTWLTTRPPSPPPASGPRWTSRASSAATSASTFTRCSCGRRTRGRPCFTSAGRAGTSGTRTIEKRRVWGLVRVCLCSFSRWRGAGACVRFFFSILQRPREVGVGSHCFVSSLSTLSPPRRCEPPAPARRTRVSPGRQPWRTHLWRERRTASLPCRVRAAAHQPGARTAPMDGVRVGGQRLFPPDARCWPIPGGGAEAAASPGGRAPRGELLWRKDGRG